VWIGAATTLSGAAFGGAISFVLNRQQMKDARSQRAEQARLDRHRRSIERRFGACAKFGTHVRAFRNALRPYGYQPVPRLTNGRHQRTRPRCARYVVRTMSEIQGVLDDPAIAPDARPWPELNGRMGAAVRPFEAAARDELEVTVLADYQPAGLAVRGCSG
jgi:hypothetical protein